MEATKKTVEKQIAEYKEQRLLKMMEREELGAAQARLQGQIEVNGKEILQLDTAVAVLTNLEFPPQEEEKKNARR